MAGLPSTKVGLVIGLLGTVAGAGFGICPQLFRPRVAPPREPLAVRLDASGPYVILVTKRASKDYGRALERAKALHPKAQQVEIDPDDLAPVEVKLKQLQPRYALVFLEPDELDVNFAWRWLETATRLDDDPFVDVRTGFMTGLTPEAVDAFVARTASAVEGRLRPPGALVDDLGPPEVGNQSYFNTVAGSEFIPAFGARFSLRSIFHGKGSFHDDRLDSLDMAGFVHFGGHGHPDRIDDGLTASQVVGLKLAPCVVFNGACYTGVTGRWYDQARPKVVEKVVPPEESFCLRMLGRDVLAYLAAVHPDHGMPVYQELEYLASRGGSLGDVIKSTYDGIVLGAGGKLPAFERFTGGMNPPRWQPADVMLKGTAARVLFADPALVPCDAFAGSPFRVAAEEKGDELRVTATLADPSLKATFTDTYFNDLNPQAPYNDRAWVSVDLPPEWTAVGKVEVAAVKAGSRTLPHRLVGHAVETDQGKRRLHVQVDVPATGFLQSAFRVAGATVELVAHRQR